MAGPVGLHPAVGHALLALALGSMLVLARVPVPACTLQSSSASTHWSWRLPTC